MIQYNVYKILSFREEVDHYHVRAVSKEGIAYGQLKKESEQVSSAIRCRDRKRCFVYFFSGLKDT